MDVVDDHEAGARAKTGKSPVAVGQSKKRARSPQADKALEDSTRKHHRMVRDWSKDEEDEDTGGIDPTGKGVAGGPDTASGANIRHEDS
jgi:hypothetical protein